MAVLVSFRPQCQRHQTILPSGCRAGFFMGDGAGVGKGRQVRNGVLCTDTVYFVLIRTRTRCDVPTTQNRQCMFNHGL